MSSSSIPWCLRRLRLAVGSFLLLVFSAVVSACGAQDLRYLSHQSWSTEEGLPQSSVHSLAQTPDGYLWVATEEGLARFDGVAFRVFGRGVEPAFLSDDICCLAAAGGSLWIGTAEGLLQWQQGRFHRYGIADGLPSSTIEAIQIRGEASVFVKTYSGWAQWQRPRFQRVSTPPAEGFSPAPVVENTSTNTTSGPGGALWTSSATMVAGIRHGIRREWQVGRELPAGRIATVVVDREGLVWVGMNNGLVVLDIDQSAPVPVAFLRGNSVLSVFEDAEGNHWIGTETSGLHVLRRLKFRSEPALAGKAVTSVVQTKDGAIWVGTRDDGLRRVRNGIVDEPVAAAGLTSAVILCLAADPQGGLWAGTPDGLNYIDARDTVQRVTSADGLPDDYVRALAAENDGSVWVGTRQGLAHLRRQGSGFSAKTLTTANGLGGDMIGALLLLPAGPNQPGELWAGTSGGLTRIRANGEIKNFTAEDGLAGTITTALAQDGTGDLWVGTKDGGLSLLRGERFVPVAGSSPAAGRAGDLAGDIEGIKADALGFLWLRMDRGVRRVALTALRACVTNGPCPSDPGAMATYGLADGLPNDEVVAGGPSMTWLAANGELWFPTRGGVAIADTEHLPVNTVAPPVVIEQFLVDDRLEGVAADSPFGAVDIPFGRGRFTMEYAGLSYTAPSEVRYRFRLEGFDKDWSDAGNRRFATYTNLPPGSYLFEVQAMNNDGLWNRAGAALPFRIIPPFYRRWWFIAFVLLALAVLLAGMYWLRLRRLQREFDAVLAERNRMAREIHDTLTQDFVGTSLQLDLIAQQLSRGKVEMAIDQVKRTRQLVTEGLEEARRSIWELRANHSQDSLPTRLTRIVQRDTQAAATPRLHVCGAYRPLDPRVERELLRIAQEALSNVQRHAQATAVSIELLYGSDTLLLTIEDDGIGFSADETSPKDGHYGLLGMKERASSIDGTLEIGSHAGQGTKVRLIVPIASSTR